MMNNNYKNNKITETDDGNTKQSGCGGCGCLLIILLLIAGGLAWLRAEVGESGAFLISGIVVGLAIGLGFACTAIFKAIGHSSDR